MKTLTTNRFDKFFGPVGSSIGQLIILAGIGLAFVELPALLLIPFGLLIGFTHSATTIDFQNKKVRFSNNLAGFLKFGKWMDIHSDMYVEVNRNNKVYRTYSRGNRTLDIKTHQYEISLYNDQSQKLMPLKYCKTIEDAKASVEEIKNGLDL